MLTDEQVTHWKSLQERWLADTQFIQQGYETDALRVKVQPAMQDLLARYLSGKINNSQLRETFQLRAVNEWNVFGLSGFSGAMFLNMLVKNVTDQTEAGRQLKLVLPVPPSVDDGYERLTNFAGFLKQLSALGLLSGKAPYASHCPFFVSVWWHIQDPENWPIFYVSSRQALKMTGVYTPQSNLVEDYFEFREAYLALESELDLNAWELEHLCVWQQERASAVPTSDPQPSIVPVIEHADQLIEEYSHSQIQWLLARIGDRLGCRIWIAANDRNKVWDGERLGDYSIDALPYLGLDPKSQRVMELIDVLWLNRANRIEAAFEVEHTTLIYSGLLRMSDLAACAPNISFPLYIVTSETRMPKVRDELSRPTFQALELHKRCGFFSYEALMQEAEHIMRWAKSPAAIGELAQHVSTIE